MYICIRMPTFPHTAAAKEVVTKPEQMPAKTASAAKPAVSAATSVAKGVCTCACACACVCVCPQQAWQQLCRQYGVATGSRLLKIIGLFCRI